MTNYDGPVAILVTLGVNGLGGEWRNYRNLGIGPEHVPDLIRMALDKDLHIGDTEGTEVWAPIHAMRALGQLGAPEATEPLLTLFRRIDEEQDDWVGEDLPEVYGLIGPEAIPALQTYLGDRAHGLWARTGAANALKEIATRHPESRAAVVAILTGQLEHFAENDPTLNGSLLAHLLDLHSIEAAPVIERAFAAKAIDPMIAGDWEDVQIEFGMLKSRITPKPRSPLEQLFEPFTFPTRPPPPPRNSQVDAAIARMRAEGMLKQPIQPEPEQVQKRKKKVKKKKK